MEIYGVAVDDLTGDPVAYATVQRLYPDGQIYSDPIVADINGFFNGRVPDTNYKWNITSAGYHGVIVPLTGAISEGTATVRLQRNDELAPVTVTPNKNKVNNTALYVGLFVAAVFFAKQQKLF